jgi:hypothetical protein
MAAAAILTFAVMSVIAVTAAPSLGESLRGSKPNVIILFADDFVSVEAFSIVLCALAVAHFLPPHTHTS